jgi:hypothetical protein
MMMDTVMLDADHPHERCHVAAKVENFPVSTSYCCLK